jgi:hypothetical protein
VIAISLARNLDQGPPNYTPADLHPRGVSL